MKSLIIFCIMGLISIFDCKGGGVIRKEVFGPELVDQVRWCEVGLSWYEYNVNPGWIGDGVKLILNDETKIGAIGKTGFLIKDNWYRVVLDVIYVSGWVEVWGGVGVENGGVYSANGYPFAVQYGGHFEFDMISGGNFGIFYIDSSMFVGSINSLSVKKVNYIEEDE